jgi:2-polyprenyl-6-methoxyphenol hydroxylase-like FAD-dependent oxidoreductase
MKILISGGGIAGLTAAFWLKKAGFTPVIVEKSAGLRKEGYMIDFFGSGWDVAERMGLVLEVKNERYHIENFSFVDVQGEPYFRIPVGRVRDALKGRYTYLLRGDLEKILYDSVKNEVEIRFGNSVKKLEQNEGRIGVTFEDGREETFDFLIGADGVHSKVRELLFGAEEKFSHYLGYYVAAFTVPNCYGLPRDVMIYQEPDRQAGLYPLNEGTLATAYLFKSPDLGFVSPETRKEKLIEVFRGAGWITEQVLKDIPEEELIFFDSLTQIQMPSWSLGRSVLIGDACGCLTLMAGQGASMAIAGAYVLSQELKKYPQNFSEAFKRYERFLEPAVSKKQRQAEKFSHNFVSGSSWRIKFRRFWTHLAMTRFFLPLTMQFFGAKSILKDFHDSE